MKTGLVIAVAAAALFVAGCATQGTPCGTCGTATQAACACKGMNSCKGDCSCKGMNSCKGKCNMKKHSKHHKAKAAAEEPAAQ
ncbi:MAG: hypothetical protein A3I12_07580 [Gammaproteobacteria bacterium RIFCSPLOWO2_02_FULL_38_11]|nr:MAG: hypothetical protein A3B69_05685 [Gammaproteobacteria bacterium RIFCSPHIGHO2_02_FULL_38_33]OGT24448.1 MAG: hypothetical protein A2W47_05140 [Gammaproteobacteria bacterium RIFCSPHIGHO2_12_38_15]OGT68405.1 MAG: hypothetical protein A3I12_07580 [Gammaproteobacteria bacterium RIFCSPLOWO2_02_FULL_38_11]OGT77429.1 MAG: hypothetical protein A3G71_01130 [Gammaproteobacteria bacterium RIFCSPLOWO2_12_FULL_38_14]